MKTHLIWSSVAIMCDDPKYSHTLEKSVVIFEQWCFTNIDTTDEKVISVYNYGRDKNAKPSFFYSNARLVTLELDRAVFSAYLLRGTSPEDCERLKVMIVCQNPILEWVCD